MHDQPVVAGPKCALLDFDFPIQDTPALIVQEKQGLLLNENEASMAIIKNQTKALSQIPVMILSCTEHSLLNA